MLCHPIYALDPADYLLHSSFLALLTSQPYFDFAISFSDSAPTFEMQFTLILLSLVALVAASPIPSPHDSTGGSG